MREVSIDELPGLLRGIGHHKLADLIADTRADGQVLAGVLLGAHAALTDLDEPGDHPDPHTELLGTMGRALKAGYRGPDVLTVADIGKRFGVQRMTAYRWRDHPEFPAPVAVLSSGPVWSATDVERWHSARGA